MSPFERAVCGEQMVKSPCVSRPSLPMKSRLMESLRNVSGLGSGFANLAVSHPLGMTL